MLHMLVEGSSMRSVSRIAGASINTVSKLLEEAGAACHAYHNRNVRNISAERVQCDEIWSFCYAKEKNVERIQGDPDYAGDVWTWTGIDSDSKLIISWMTSRTRGLENATEFMEDLRSRLTNRVQLTTDGHVSYLDAVETAFGSEVDYAQVVKHYGTTPDDGRYRYRGSTKTTIVGNPNESHISTSHMERHNLTTRMSVRRYTRKTNAFSKKIDFHIHALSLHFVWYNFCRIHGSLGMTPAMAAGIANYEHNLDWLVDLTDAYAILCSGNRKNSVRAN